MKTLKTILLWSAVAVVTFLMFGFFLDRPAYEGGISEGEAREICERTIKLTSVNPASASIGLAHGQRSGETILFSWGPTDLQLQNKLGAMLGASAVCKVNLKTKLVEDFKIS